MTEHILRVTYGVPGHQHRVRYLVQNGLTQTVKLEGEPVQELMVNVVHQRTNQTPGSALRDARSLQLVKTPVNEFGCAQYYEQEYIPSRRPLWEVLADVVAHGEECPSHGINCACVDKYIREVRQHINRVIPEVERILLPEEERVPFDDNWVYNREQAEAARKARWRITHVLNAVMRSVS